MDINTIFYFPNSLTFEEYTEMLAGGDIAPRTIVFADAQKSIYKDGKKYGDISEQKFRDLLDAVKNNSWISDELDGVKGDIIRNRDTLINLDNLIDQQIQGIQSDITDANQRISSLNDSISTVNSNLNTAISNRDAAIQTKVENLFDDTEWLSENFPQGQTSWDSRWDSDLERYLLTVGYWDVDQQTGEKATKWSQLQSSVNSISSSVNDLKVNGNLTQAMTSSIESLISNDITALSLGTTYATIASVDDVEKIVEWFYSGITSSSQADKTVAQMSAMSKNDFIAAISDIRTQVDKVANGDFVAQTEVSSKVGDTIANMLLQSSSDNALAALSAKANANSDNISALILGMTGSTSTANLSTNVSTALNNLTSGLISSADAGTAIDGAVATAKSEIYSAISAKDSNDNFISLAALKTQADADHATVSLLSQNQVDTSGFVAKTELGTAVASLFASTGDAQNPTAKANVVAVVKDNKSALNLSAQDVNIDGYLTGGSASFKGDVEATSFTTGASNTNGITVLSGAFDPSDPSMNTHKAYFAYDPEQGGITMWFYCDDVWKRLDLNSSSVQEDPETFVETYLYTGTVLGTYLLQDNTKISEYYSRLTGKYYTTTSATSQNYLNASGYFFMDGFQAAVDENSWTITDPTVYLTDQIPNEIQNVPSELGLGQKPLLLFGPRFVHKTGRDMQVRTIQNGVVTSTEDIDFSYNCDTVYWHAAGDPLPEGIIPQNSQTPSINDAFAYAIWRPGLHEIIKKTVQAGDEFCIAGGNGIIYKDEVVNVSSNFKQYLYRTYPLSNYATPRNLGINTTDSEYNSLNGPLLSNAHSYHMYKLHPDYVTQVGNSVIWHCVPMYTYSSAVQAS